MSKEVEEFIKQRGLNPQEKLDNDTGGYWKLKDLLVDFFAENEAEIERLKQGNSEPKNCIKEYDENVCGDCEFSSYKLVPHPGGSSTDSARKYHCEQGHWEDDF